MARLPRRTETDHTSTPKSSSDGKVEIRSAPNKFEFVRRILANTPVERVGDKQSLLDVGCRDCALREYVQEFVAYSGVDLFQNESGTVAHVLDVSRGMPFDSNEFDLVVALDLLEHLDDLEGGLDEMVRVARRKVLLMLPNIAHLIFRMKFLLTGKLGGKYDLTLGHGKDRHRWVTVLSQCDEFIEQYASARALQVRKYWFVDTWKKRALAAVCRGLLMAPDWWVWASLYVLEKPELLGSRTETRD